jgi:hypothetical protein
VRRISILVAMVVMVASLTLTGPALASTTSYSGTFSSSGKLSFKLLRNRTSAVRLSSLRFAKFPLSCDAGPNTETAMLDPNYEPLQPRFPELYFLAVYTKPHYPHPLSRLVLAGRVHQSGSVATGTMRIRGRKVPTDEPGNGSSDRCDSGFVRWSATRQ